MKERIMRIENKIEQRSYLNLKTRQSNQYSAYKKSNLKPATTIENDNSISMYESAQTYTGSIQNRETISDGRIDSVEAAAT